MILLCPKIVYNYYHFLHMKPKHNIIKNSMRLLTVPLRWCGKLLYLYITEIPFKFLKLFLPLDLQLIF